MNNHTLLTVNNLRTDIHGRKGIVSAVRGIDFSIAAGECLGIVGESGCGKSVSMLSLLGLMPKYCLTYVDQLQFKGETLSLEAFQQQRGKRVTYIFQDPMSSLNPTMKIGWQIAEPMIVHSGLDKRTAWNNAIALMEQVGINDASGKAHSYPFQFSGGMLQRAAIAMAIANKPDLLIADEPTTALDVTLQTQVLSLLRDLQQSMGLSIILISHDLGVVTHIADRVNIMYAGEVVETGDCQNVFSRPAHPYTLALKQSLPGRNKNIPLKHIPGHPPELIKPIETCSFVDRCEKAMKLCTRQRPGFYKMATQQCRCWLYEPERKPNDTGGKQHG